MLHKFLIFAFISVLSSTLFAAQNCSQIFLINLAKKTTTPFKFLNSTTTLKQFLSTLTGSISGQIFVLGKDNFPLEKNSLFTRSKQGLLVLNTESYQMIVEKITPLLLKHEIGLLSFSSVDQAKQIVSLLKKQDLNADFINLESTEKTFFESSRSKSKRQFWVTIGQPGAPAFLPSTVHIDFRPYQNIEKLIQQWTEDRQQITFSQLTDVALFVDAQNASEARSFLKFLRQIKKNEENLSRMTIEEMLPLFQERQILEENLRQLVFQSKWKTYDEVVELVRKARLLTVQDFKNWKKPNGVPSNPNLYYKKSGWVDWPTFFGETPRLQKWLSYDEVVELVRKERLWSLDNYRAWRKPKGVPSHPDIIYYKKGWKDWQTFLGKKSKKWLSYDEVQKKVDEAGIRTQQQYQQWKKPDGVPSNPQQVYNGRGWKNWTHFFYGS